MDLPRPDGGQQSTGFQSEEDQYEDALTEIQSFVQKEQHDVDSS